MLEGQRRLLENHVPDLGTRMLGTSKVDQIVGSGREYGGAWRVVNPENHGEEPKTDDPNIQSTDKAIKIIKHKPEDVEGKVTAFTADVAFKRPGENGLVTYHKPKGANGDLTPEERAKYIEETKQWFSTDAFVVYWLISFVVADDKDMQRLATIQIKGEYKKALPEYLIGAMFNPKINARLPLVEMGKDGDAKFFVSNVGESEDVEIEISQEMAEQLVVARVLPLNSMIELITKLSDELVLENWVYVYLTLTEFLKKGEKPS